MAVFSDTTNLSGLVQIFAFWAGIPQGDITGNLLKDVTVRINSAFEMILPRVLSYNDHIRWDDINHTDAPIGTTDIISGQPDYKITVDDNSLDILNITRVRIYQSSSATDYVDLIRLFVNEKRALDAMSPNPGDTGSPTHFVESGGKIFLSPKPNFTASNGLKFFFERQQVYFVSTDTTKKPGIPLPFHELLALYPALDWILVNRPDNGVLITRLEARILKKETDLDYMISVRNPTQVRMSVVQHDNE